MYIPPSPEEGFDATDARMDAMLREFFQAETPASLPLCSNEAPDDWTSLAPLEAKPKRNWDFATPVLLASAAVLVVCGLFALPKPGDGDIAKAPVGPTFEPTPAFYTPDVVGLPKSPTTRLRSTSEWRETNAGKYAYTVTDGDSLVDLKYYTTSLGKVEQRTNIEWTTVRVFEPESGEWLQATVPSIRVDVVRLGQ